MPVRLVILDMDGVIFSGPNFWLELHRIYNTEEAALRLAENHLTTNYRFLAHTTALHLWRGRGAGPLLELVEQREYEPGVRELFAYFRRAGIESAIVSSGPHQLAERAQAELGVDQVWANRLEIRNGRLTGMVDVRVDDSAKGHVARLARERTGRAVGECAAIGDARPDVAMIDEVGYFIAYAATDEVLIAKADYLCPKGELASLVKVFEEVEISGPPERDGLR